MGVLFLKARCEEPPPGPDAHPELWEPVNPHTRELLECSATFVRGLKVISQLKKQSRGASERRLLRKFLADWLGRPEIFPHVQVIMVTHHISRYALLAEVFCM